MNKAILKSIRPQHVVNILNDKKTIELDKRLPKHFVGWVYIYCTKAKPKILVNHGVNAIANGKVVARFWYDDYDDISLKYHINKNQIERVIEQACVSYEDFDNYVGDRENIYGWHIKNLEIFDKPMALNEFYSKDTSQLIGTAEGIHRLCESYRLKRAPQSWQYVWVKE